MSKTSRFSALKERFRSLSSSGRKQRKKKDRVKNALSQTRDRKHKSFLSGNILMENAPLITGVRSQAQDIVSEETNATEGNNFDSKEEVDGSFLRFFLSSNGPKQIIVVCVVLSCSIGCTAGVIPAVMMDRYARLNHDFDGELCSSFAASDRPIECKQGSDDAQSASAIAAFVNNFSAFLTSSLIGSISDTRGRRGMFITSISFSLIAPALLVAIQMNKSLNPFWYYAGRSISGVINWITIALSSISDVVPPQWRAPSFGLLIAGFSCGFAISPVVAIPLGHFGVSVLSLLMLIGCALFVICFVPETLPIEVRDEALRLKRIDALEHANSPSSKCVHVISRPLREMSILNRSKLFHLLSLLAFFSGIVSSADQSLVLYYVENRLAFNDTDVAIFFLIFGVLGIFVQGFLLKPLNDLIGERLVLVVGFSGGALNNFLYGVAKTKLVVFIAGGIGSLNFMTFSVISAIKSNNVDELEQGRIQGALYGVQSLASALGPYALNFVYKETKDLEYPGPGTMWFVAALLYLFAVATSFSLPKEQTDSKFMTKRSDEPIKRNKYDISDTLYGSF